MVLSVGYASSDLTYQWTAGRGVNIASDMKLSQFDLISTPTGNETMYLNHGEEDDNIFHHFVSFCSGYHSTLLVSFHLQRHMGDFVIQVMFTVFALVVNRRPPKHTRNMYGSYCKDSVILIMILFRPLHKFPSAPSHICDLSTWCSWYTLLFIGVWPLQSIGCDILGFLLA